MVGRASGRQLHALAHNRDPRRVVVGRRRRSIGGQRAIGRGPHTFEFVDAVLVGLVDRVSRRLRGARRVCRTIVLRLRFDDFSRATRSHTLLEATAETRTILIVARGLLAAVTPLVERQGITLVGIALTNLEDDSAVQIALPLECRRAVAIDAAVDAVRERFGTTAITRAVLLGRDQTFTAPLLPD
jgi:DNA polymerase IV